MPTLSASTAEAIWADLSAGNHRFVAGAPQPRDLVRERQAVVQSQNPKAVVLTCFDGRVTPEIIFDQRLGDLLVVRVAGNVPDKTTLGSLEFAARHVGVPLLVVVGHQYCAAVQFACSCERTDSPHLKAIVKAIRSSGAWTESDGRGEGALRAAEKANARYVAGSILERSEALRERVQRGELAIVAAYYHLDTGVVERL